MVRGLDIKLSQSPMELLALADANEDQVRTESTSNRLDNRKAVIYALLQMMSNLIRSS